MFFVIFFRFQRFQDLFNYSTTAGVWDRFLFGLCPANFQFVYRRFSGMPEKIFSHRVELDPDIDEWVASFRKENINPRVLEIVVRSATICAMFDGVRVVGIDRTAPHIELARYQMRIRQYLEPNPGENFERQLAFKIRNYLSTHPGWVWRRELFHNIRTEDKGISIAARVLSQMIAYGEVIMRKNGKRIELRLAGPQEEVDDDD
jgi:hypothetical protein